MGGPFHYGWPALVIPWVAPFVGNSRVAPFTSRQRAHQGSQAEQRPEADQGLGTRARGWYNGRIRLHGPSDSTSIAHVPANCLTNARAKNSAGGLAPVEPQFAFSWPRGWPSGMRRLAPGRRAPGDVVIFQIGRGLAAASEPVAGGPAQNASDRIAGLVEACRVQPHVVGFRVGRALEPIQDWIGACGGSQRGDRSRKRPQAIRRACSSGPASTTCLPGRLKRSPNS